MPTCDHPMGLRWYSTVLPLKSTLVKMTNLGIEPIDNPDLTN